MSGPPPSPEEQAAAERIWHADPDGLARSAPCHPNSWAGSVQRDLLTAGPDANLSTVGGPFAPYLACAAVLMVKDEADIIGRNLDWLHQMGVRRFIVMDNASRDATWDVVMAFQAARADAELLAIRDPIVAHLQARKTSGMCQLGRCTWPDVKWIVPVDADEFLVARHGLRALIYVPDHVQALTIPKVVHFRPLPVTPDEANAADWLAGMSVRSSLFAVPPKVILRADPVLSVGDGNHYALLPDGARVSYAGGFQYGFFHREFQTRSFAQFHNKVRNGGVAVLTANAAGIKVGGDHWLAWYRLLQKGGEAALREEYARVAYRALGHGYRKEGLLF